MICASEQSVIVLNFVYDEVKDEFQKRGCYFLNEEEKQFLMNWIDVIDFQ